MNNIALKHYFYLAISALILFSGCSGGSGNQQQGGFNFGGMQRATTVEVVDVSQQSISQIVRAYGTIRAQDNVRITPQISERVTNLYVDLGDTVSQGQLLARLRDVNFVDQVRRDEAQLEQARLAMRRDSLELRRGETLFERNLVSDSELENIRVSYQNSRASFQAARASLTQTRENLSYTEVRSPVRGVVTRRNISPGDVASSATAIFEIANLVGYEIRIFLPLADRRLTRIGQEVNVRLSGEREPAAKGIVSRISPELDSVTGLAEVVISLTDVQREVLPGSLAEASITVLTRPNSIVIPRTALVENVQTILDPESNTIRLDRSYSAFVTVGDTVANMRTLELGLQQGDRIEILSGLEAGEKLIITGQGGLEEGSAIRLTGRGRPEMSGQQRPQSPDSGN
jgi:RND family efflux transporter MFP subunit